LFKHKWVILLPLLIIPPLGFFYARTLTPVYVATARIQITGTDLQQLLPEAAIGSTSNRSLLNDQVLLLTSDYLLEKLVDRMHLADLMNITSSQDLSKNERVSAVILQLKSSVLRVTAIPKTHSISISAQWPENPDLPTQIANQLAEVYVDTVKKQIEDAALTFSQTYQSQAEVTQKDLDEANLRIEEFLTENSIASVEGRMQSMTEALSKVQQTLWNYRNDLVSLEVEIESIEDQLAKANPELKGATSIVINPEYAQAQNYLDGLLLRRANELGRWKPDSPRIQNLDKQIDEAQMKLDEIDPQMEVDAQRAANPVYEELQKALPQLRILKLSTERKVEVLEDEEKELNREILEFGQVSQEYEQLMTRKNELAEQLRFERGRIVDAGTQRVFVDQITDVRIVDSARRPLAPSPTKRNLIILMSIAGAFGVGLGLAGLRELLNQSLETTDDVSKHLQMPVLGAIPDKVLR